ncbi:MAG: carbamoyltransferase C-terminal domain-containing protein [Bdellovibrionales bacterium]
MDIKKQTNHGYFAKPAPLNTLDGQRFNLGIHGSHNGAIAISYGATVLEVVEIERWVKKKNAGLFHYFPVPNPLEVLDEILDYFEDKYGAKNYHNAMENSFPPEHYNKLRADNIQFVPHHIAHVSNVFYQSNARRTLNISFDGGSDDGYFNVFEIDRGSEPRKIKKSNHDLCVAYQAAGHYIPEIKQEDIWWGNLVYSGKVMGLSAYGKKDEKLIERVKKYFKSVRQMFVDKAYEKWEEEFTDKLWKGQKGRDLAFAVQYVFEERFKELTQYNIENKDNRQLQMSGGGAMNILNNSNYDSFVSPQADDRGIALGCLLHLLRPNRALETAYLGPEPWDALPEVKEEITTLDVSRMLEKGLFVGLIQGRMEYGARALGNRSILAKPGPGVKDKLNADIKNRESFRPFAAVVRAEDFERYFEGENPEQYQWMTHNARFRKGKEVEGVAHVDGTCRVQTVTKKQNPFLWRILLDTPIILNTSFNIQGQPILNTYEDALKMKSNTGLDEVITDKYRL